MLEGATAAAPAKVTFKGVPWLELYYAKVKGQHAFALNRARIHAAADAMAGGGLGFSIAFAAQMGLVVEACKAWV